MLQLLVQKTLSDWLKFFDSQSEASIPMVFEAITRNKTEHTFERVWKTGPENGVFLCVPFCLRSLGPFERCDML